MSFFYFFLHKYIEYKLSLPKGHLNSICLDSSLLIVHLITFLFEYYAWSFATNVLQEGGYMLSEILFC